MTANTPTGDRYFYNSSGGMGGSGGRKRSAANANIDRSIYRTPVPITLIGHDWSGWRSSGNRKLKPISSPNFTGPPPNHNIGSHPHSLIDPTQIITRKDLGK